MTEKKVLTASEIMNLASKNSNVSEENSTVVQRPLDQENDCGNLLGVECNEFELNESTLEEELLARARDNCQLLLNEIWTVPTERVEEAIVAVLPPTTTKLPREKPLPKAKPLTKWEQYAKEKGIKKEKKSKLVWDDVVKEWIPRFGMKKAKAEVEKNWLMPYKEGQSQDPFKKAIEDKRERVAKNELQRLRNIARAKKTKVPGVGLTPTVSNQAQSSDDLKKASQLATKATASLGKFQEKLPTALEKKVKAPRGKKRQFDPLVNNDEKAKNLKVLEELNSKKAKISVNKVVGKQMNREENERRSNKPGKGKKDGRGKKGGKGRAGGKGQKGSFGGKGKMGGKGFKSGGAGGKKGGKK